MGGEVNREEFLGNFDCEKSTGMNGKKLSKVLVQDFLCTLTLKTESVTPYISFTHNARQEHTNFHLCK